MAGATADLLTQAKADPKSLEKYSRDSERYEKDKASIKEKAEALAKQSEAAGERAEGFHMGEVFLEIGIVLSSLAILTKQRGFFYGGGVASAVGLVFAIRAYLMH
jgi:hypothetical protein